MRLRAFVPAVGAGPVDGVVPGNGRPRPGRQSWAMSDSAELAADSAPSTIF